ncbi:hypothetical protein GCM10010398_65780 [Streptomyces fimbriatus]
MHGGGHRGPSRREDEIFDALGEETGAGLHPIGEADRRDGFPGIAPTGAVCIGRDGAVPPARTAGEALEKLVEGASAGGRRPDRAGPRSGDEAREPGHGDPASPARCAVFRGARV